MLTLVSARLCGGCGDGPAALAAGIEVFHMATLLHDDVVDGSGMRRGIASANAVWGNRASVLVGDYLIARAFRLILDSGPAPEVLELFAEATSAMAAGELRHMGDAARPGCDIEAYLEVVEGKTAALFATACRFGAIAAGARRDAAAALGSYGRNLGVAFQLADDVLDWSGRQAVLGKAVGDDFAEGKTTLPVILAFQRGDAEERAFWRRTFEEGDRRAGDFGRALELLERRGALADTLALARDHADDAGRSLGCFPAGPVRRRDERLCTVQRRALPLGGGDGSRGTHFGRDFI